MNRCRRGDICLRHPARLCAAVAVAIFDWRLVLVESYPTELRLDARCEGGMARVHPTRRAAGHGAPIDATNTSVLLSWANHTDVEDAQYDENEPTRQIPFAWTFPPGKREYCDDCRLGLAVSHEDPNSMMLITASAGSFHDQGVLLNGNGNRPATACSGRRLYTTREATVHNLIWCAPEKSASIETVEFHITASGGASMPFKRYIFVLQRNITLEPDEDLHGALCFASERSPQNSYFSYLTLFYVTLSLLATIVVSVWAVSTRARRSRYSALGAEALDREIEMPQT